MNLVLVYGTAAPPGRLAQALGTFAECAAARHGAETSTVDLHATSLDWADGRAADDLPPDTTHVLGQIGSAEAITIFSPVYRAGIPGVLKNLFDVMPLEALEGKPLGIVAMGATAHHYLAVDGDLRRVAAWFGATTLPTSVYLSAASFQAGVLTEPALQDIRYYVDMTAGFVERLAGFRPGLRPLAAASAT